jgi:hypothetical protein
MNRLEAWHREGAIELLIPEPTYQELSAEGHPARMSKAGGYIRTGTAAETDDEKALLQKLAAIIFPKGTQGNDDKDVENVFNAQKNWGALVTADGEILGAKQKLATLKIRVMTAEEACSLVEERLALNPRR